MKIWKLTQFLILIETIIYYYSDHESAGPAACMLPLVPALEQQYETQQHLRPHFGRVFLFSPLGLGKRKPTSPPNKSRAATIRMGMKGSTVINLPKLRLPRMDPTRPNTDWIPNAVDLRDGWREGRRNLKTTNYCQCQYSRADIVNSFL